jgi:hypothetical protein
MADDHGSRAEYGDDVPHSSAAAVDAMSALFDLNQWVTIHRVELICQAGNGLSTGQGSDPQVMFRISRDGGQTYGQELTMATGKIGEYQRRCFLNILGRSRNTVFELSSSDPCFNSWILFTVDATPGTS